MTARISAVVITKNEEENITDCLAQLTWADELVVVDSFSSDRTVFLAKAAGAIVHQRAFVSFPEQRNAALAVAAGDWVFFVDADERSTAHLCNEVRAVVNANESRFAGFWVPRRNIIWGQWIKHGGWYPDYQLRLLRRGQATYDVQREVHEVVRLVGEAGFLSHQLLHHNYRHLRQFLDKQEKYSSFEAKSMFRVGVRPKPRNYILQPWREWYRRYIQLGGVYDGGHGLLLATLLGYYNLRSYWKLRILWMEHTGGEEPIS